MIAVDPAIRAGWSPDENDRHECCYADDCVCSDYDSHCSCQDMREYGDSTWG